MTRRMWTDEQKQKIIAEARIAGVKETSKKHNLNPILVYRWQKKIKKQAQPLISLSGKPSGNVVPIYVDEEILREIITKVVADKLKQ